MPLPPGLPPAGDTAGLSGCIFPRMVSITTPFFTLRVWVRGKSSSGQTVKPRILCCSASWPLVQETTSWAVSASSRIKAACTSTEEPLVSPTTVASVTFGCFASTAWMSSGKDILAAGEDDHILFPALDVQEPLAVEEPQVARPVPVPVEGRCSLLGCAPVTRGDAVPGAPESRLRC